jgi:hypothetical protein
VQPLGSVTSTPAIFQIHILKLLRKSGVIAEKPNPQPAPLKNQHQNASIKTQEPKLNHQNE